MTKTLQKVFHIREGEFKLALLMQLYIFLIICVLLLVKPTVNALFLSHLGSEELPTAYLLVAALAIFTTFFYNRLLRVANIKTVAIISLVFFSLCFLLLSYFLYANTTNDFILYAYYLSISLFGVLITSQFWIIANMVYNAREAKRLFGFIGAGAIAGGIFGGYLTSIISSHFGNDYVILLAAILLLICIPILIWVWNHKASTITQIKPTKQDYTDVKKESILHLVFSSKHLTYLALTIGVSVIMAKLVDYQFSDFAHIKITNSQDLAAFFGFWFSTFNVISLAIQLFLTNRLLEWLGVSTNLLILPLGIAFGCLLFLIFPELWVLILLKGMDTSFKQSINKAATELSIMPIAYETKKRAKYFIDVIVDSVATGIAGFLLIFVVKQFDLHSRYITIIILFFLFVWIILIFKLREAYFDSFKNNILKAIGHFNINEFNEQDLSMNTSVIKVLTEGSDKDIIELLNNLGDTILEIHEPYILKLLDHPNNEVKAAAIKEIYFFKHDAGLNKIKSLVETNPDPEVVYEAMEYLLLHTSLNDDLLFEDYLDHEKKHIADAALLCLAELALENKYLAKKYNLNERIESKIKDINNPKIKHPQEEIAEFLVTVGYARNPNHYHFIHENLSSDNTYIQLHAIKAAGLTQHLKFIKPILKFLNNDTLRPTAIKALKQFGNDISQYILELDLHEPFKEDVRIHFPEVIASIRSKDSLKILLRLGKSKDAYMRFKVAKTLVNLHLKDVGVKLDKTQITKAVLHECEFYIGRLIQINTLSKVHENNEQENTEFSIKKEQLLGLLVQELDYSMNVIFEVLSLVLNERDMEIAYFGLKDESESVKVNAIEYLDNLLIKGLKTDLIPILEHHFIQEKDLSELTDPKSNPITEIGCYISLLKNGTTKIKLATLDVIAQVSDKTAYIQILKLKTLNKNLKISQKAQNILDSIKD